MKRIETSFGIFSMTLFIAWVSGLDFERGMWQGFALLCASVLAGYVYIIQIWEDDK